MREIRTHIVNPVNDSLKIMVLDEPGHGGACHTYAILAPQDIESNNQDASSGDAQTVIANRAVIHFQNGPINEHGINGVTQEALLAIVQDRLESFQKGQYSCRENAIALTHLETAMLWLQKRTLNRMARGVEGTHQK